MFSGKVMKGKQPGPNASTESGPGIGCSRMLGTGNFPDFFGKLHLGTQTSNFYNDTIWWFKWFIASCQGGQCCSINIFSLKTIDSDAYAMAIIDCLEKTSQSPVSESIGNFDPTMMIIACLNCC